MTYCNNCGAEISCHAIFCPSCGKQTGETSNQQVPSLPPQPPLNNYHLPLNKKKEPLNALAITGFVISCISIFLNLDGAAGITAIAMSIIGMIQIFNDGGRGKGFALAGIIIGACSLIWILFLSFFRMPYLYF